MINLEFAYTFFISEAAATDDEEEDEDDVSGDEQENVKLAPTVLSSPGGRLSSASKESLSAERPKTPLERSFPLQPNSDLESTPVVSASSSKQIVESPSQVTDDHPATTDAFLNDEGSAINDAQRTEVDRDNFSVDIVVVEENVTSQTVDVGEIPTDDVDLTSNETMLDVAGTVTDDPSQPVGTVDTDVEDDSFASITSNTSENVLADKTVDGEPSGSEAIQIGAASVFGGDRFLSRTPPPLDADADDDHLNVKNRSPPLTEDLSSGGEDYTESREHVVSPDVVEVMPGEVNNKDDVAMDVALGKDDDDDDADIFGPANADVTSLKQDILPVKDKDDGTPVKEEKSDLTPVKEDKRDTTPVRDKRPSAQ